MGGSNGGARGLGRRAAVGVVEHELVVPYSVPRLVEQFFDFEHVPHVHPRSLGRVETLDLGRHALTARIHWPPAAGLRLRSTFREEFRAPNRIRVRVVDGFGRGTRYRAAFLPVPGGTRVVERLLVPGSGGFLVRILRPLLRRAMRRVWEEDLRVHMCRGGLPGVEAVGIVLPEA